MIIEEELAAEHTFLNGRHLISDDKKLFKKELKDLDRIIFGSNTTFLVRVPVNDVID